MPHKRDKIAEKDHKPSLGVNVIYFELNGFDASLSPLDAVGSSRILKGKQKLGLTFDSDKLGVIDFTKLSKLTMCSA